MPHGLDRGDLVRPERVPAARPVERAPWREAFDEDQDPPRRQHAAPQVQQINPVVVEKVGFYGLPILPEEHGEDN